MKQLTLKFPSLPLVVLLTVVFFVQLAWATFIPFSGYPYGAPDEIHHFEVTRFIGETGRLPVFGPDKDLYIRVRPGAEDNVNTRIYGWSALFPSGAYVLSGILIKVLQPLSFPQQVFVARMFSVFCHLCLVYFTYRMVRHLFPESAYLAWGVPIFIGFIPQVAFVGAYHNPDILTMAATTASLWLGMRLLDRECHWTTYLFLGLALSFVVVAKQNGWIVSAMFVGVILLLIFRDLLHSRKLYLLFPVFLIPGFVLGCWFLSQQLNYGDFLAREVFRTAWANDRPFLIPLAQQGYSIYDFLSKTDWLPMLFRSFFGVFGYLSVHLHPAIYRVLFILCLLALLGLFKGTLRRILSGNFHLKSQRTQMLCVFVMLIVLLFLAAGYTSYYNDYQPQGRYLFPVVAPLGLFFLLGWRELLPEGRWRLLGVQLLCLGMALLNLFCLVAYAIPGMTLKVSEQWFF